MSKRLLYESCKKLLQIYACGPHLPRDKAHGGHSGHGVYFKKVDTANIYYYALRFIFENLGYCSKYFGEYDSHRAGFDRHHVKKIERIGKKYQWIAMYNILARLSDKYKLKGWDWNDKTDCFYEGPWEPYVRDFDPTPHKGHDYAAPAGTPVVTIGDGVVTSARNEGAGGNTVRIRHNSVYSTAYLHLSRYASGLKAGKRVKQGEVIGYVGSTGRSTGPHLDFRVWKNGSPINPLKIESPPA